MGLKKYKPITSGQRWWIGSNFEEITKSKPEKKLTIRLKKSGGRNLHGHITVRHRGGGHKRRYRIIDFSRDKRSIPAKVIAVEYDPNRSSRIALLEYEDGERRYIIHPAGLSVNEVVASGPEVEVKLGNAMPIRNIPSGTPIHNIELFPGSGGTLVRSAGSQAQIMAKEGDVALIKLPSGEVRKFSMDCYATVGQVGNIEHSGYSLGKAGRSRWLGRRPSVRGVAMNPVDHPMGGGEGKSSGGRHPSTPWGKITKGLKTRKSKKSDRLILKRRKNE